MYYFQESIFVLESSWVDCVKNNNNKAFKSQMLASANQTCVEWAEAATKLPFINLYFRGSLQVGHVFNPRIQEAEESQTL